MYLSFKLFFFFMNEFIHIHIHISLFFSLVHYFNPGNSYKFNFLLLTQCGCRIMVNSIDRKIKICHMGGKDVHYFVELRRIYF